MHLRTCFTVNCFRQAVLSSLFRQRSASKVMNLACFQLTVNNESRFYQSVSYSSASRIYKPQSIESESDSGEYEELVNRYLHMPSMGHQVFVIQPYVKWGPGKKHDTSPELQLSEAVSLIRTLHKWQVVEEITVPVKRLDTNVIFGSGNLEKLKQLVKKNKQISAVFVSVSMLKGFQRREFEETFKVKVFDRYSIVLQIFKEHAVTSDAKLQVSLAEIPYLRAVLNSSSSSNRQSGGNVVGAMRGSGESDVDIGKRLLETVEGKLKSKLEKVREQRALSSKKREKLNIPLVAVVGYTNAGKTSLVKALTGEKAMQPSSNLFATLDVTVHEGMLPNRLKVLYIDTVGFMSDLPVPLLQCFLATLEDVALADVILHICDLSHPNVKAQAANVLHTLTSLHVSEELIKNMITIGNKCDKDELYSLSELNLEPVKISATQMNGINSLTNTIEKAIMKATKRKNLTIRVPAGGDE
ncbi:hypothetical protein B566_EDAN017199, partial [Ephemera danica]